MKKDNVKHDKSEKGNPLVRTNLKTNKIEKEGSKSGDTIWKIIKLKEDNYEQEKHKRGQI